jgi:hypothetical protein
MLPIVRGREKDGSPSHGRKGLEFGHVSGHSGWAIFIGRLVTDLAHEWAVQRARYMTL